MNNELNQTYLLVSLQEESEVVKQELLEIATEYSVIPYSVKGNSSAYIFKCNSENILFSFKERLFHQDLPITVETYTV